MSAPVTYTIGELAQVAGVTTRTIRYYVAEGLLPPPRGGGRAATYGAGHLRRLELIKLLKEEYLPLNEIKALLDGLDDDSVQDLLVERHPPSPPSTSMPAKTRVRALLQPAAASPPSLRQAASIRAQSPAAQPLGIQAKSRFAAQPSPVAAEPPRPMAEARPSQEESTVWQRYRLHPDIELHVRRPSSDRALSSRLDRLIADIRRLITKHSEKA